jgi:PhzF family phenazine biosynthesis protein
VPLCGHATLATAAVLFYEFDILANEVSFETKSGILTAKKDKSGIVLDFPIDKPIPIRLNKAFLEAVGIADFKNVEYARRLKTLVVHISDENAVKGLRPNFELMKTLRTKEEILGVIVTSHGRPPFDFVSRFFAPWLGINEDPVTGAAHTILAPYWSRVLGKNEMLAYQASDRGGKLAVRLHPNNRVDLIGNAVIVLKGELYLR